LITLLRLAAIASLNDINRQSEEPFLQTLINGLRVVAKADPDGHSMARSVEAALTVLD
jgi:hypothetical protein